MSGDGESGLAAGSDEVGPMQSRGPIEARVQATLRRSDEPPEPFRLGIGPSTYEDRRVTNESLFRPVWRRGESGDHPLAGAFVKRLRRKLGDDAACPNYFINARQVGYRMLKLSDR